MPRLRYTWYGRTSLSLFVKRDRRNNSFTFAVIKLFDKNERLAAERVWERVRIKAKSRVCNVIPRLSGQRMAFPHAAVINKSPTDPPVRRKQAELEYPLSRRGSDQV